MLGLFLHICAKFVKLLNIDTRIYQLIVQLIQVGVWLVLLVKRSEIGVVPLL